MNELSTSRGLRKRKNVDYNPAKSAEEKDIFGTESDEGGFSSDGTEDAFETTSEASNAPQKKLRETVRGHGKWRSGRAAQRRRLSVVERTEMLIQHQQIVDELVENDADRNIGSVGELTGSAPPIHTDSIGDVKKQIVEIRQMIEYNEYSTIQNLKARK